MACSLIDLFYLFHTINIFGDIRSQTLGKNSHFFHIFFTRFESCVIRKWLEIFKYLFYTKVLFRSLAFTSHRNFGAIFDRTFTILIFPRGVSSVYVYFIYKSKTISRFSSTTAHIKTILTNIFKIVF